MLRAGGRLILLDHVGSGNLAVRTGQWLLERLTFRMTSEHQTSRPLPLVAAAGFVIEHSERLKAGIVERITTVKQVPGTANPASDPQPG